MRKQLFLVLLTSAFISGCQHVQIRKGAVCTSAGTTSAGAICSRLTSSETNDLTFEEFVDFLEPQTARKCAPVKDFNVCADDQSGEKVKLPARGGAMVMSLEDFGNVLEELKVMCRELGDRCSVEARQLIENLVP